MGTKLRQEGETEQRLASLEAAVHGRKVLPKSLMQLTYHPRFGVSLVHYLNAFHEPGSPQACLKYLLALEAMFDPNGDERGRNQRVSEPASTYAATSVEQKRAMKQMLLQAYTHRGALQHGETRPERLVSANAWLRQNETSLRTLTSWAIQRVLHCHGEDSDFDPATYLNSIPNQCRQRNSLALACSRSRYQVVRSWYSGCTIAQTEFGGVRIRPVAG